MPLQRGIYKHYKGKLYEVLDLVVHSETEEELVLYKPLYGQKEAKQSLWVRPKAMFFEDVLIDGKRQARFAYVGEASK